MTQRGGKGKGESGLTDAARMLDATRGLYKQVAAELGVSVSLVSRVARGLNTSARVTAALQKALDRRMKEAAA